jgi:hypothetical protein
MCGVSTINTDKNEMKKFTIILAFIAMAINATSQIPNNGFETWENYVDNGDECSPPFNVYQKPDMWNGSLPKSCQTYSYSIQQNNESYPAGTGQFSMKIQPELVNGVRGVAISNDGHDSMKNWIPKPSFAINQRPESLYLYYKYFPSGGDTMIVQVYFYMNGVVIGNSVYGTTETISDWTALEIPMTYNTSDVPDSATIYFLTGVYIQHSESILYIDNLSFDSLITVTLTSINELSAGSSSFYLYPNPASNVVMLSANKTDRETRTLTIYTIDGILVKSETVKKNQKDINVADLPSGVYLFNIKSEGSMETKRLIIQR